MAITITNTLGGLSFGIIYNKWLGRHFPRILWQCYKAPNFIATASILFTVGSFNLPSASVVSSSIAPANSFQLRNSSCIEECA